MFREESVLAPLESWLDIDPTSDFSLANLPFGIISTSADPSPHVGVAVGSYVLDMKQLTAHPEFDRVFSDLDGQAHVLASPSLNAFAALGRAVHRGVRYSLRAILSVHTTMGHILRDNASMRDVALLPRQTVLNHLPMEIGDYTDFYAGYHHAYHVGVMFRGPENALQPNYAHLPVGYHGRSSSIVVSGTSIRRPWGQIRPDPKAAPVTSPSRKMDFELELGCLISKPNAMGEPVSVGEAEEHIFGYVLLNDWSARDIQNWEYVPLGPFNGKNFGSTISPWVVLADALEPHRTCGIKNETPLQEYLREREPDNAFDIKLEASLTSADGQSTMITETSSKNLIWSFPQMIAHHTLGGCPLRTGDLLGSGTISGPDAGQRGSLLEMSEGGTTDIMLSGGNARRFLEDWDTVTLRGFAGEDGARVGFGACVGKLEPANQAPTSS